MRHIRRYIAAVMSIVMLISLLLNVNYHSKAEGDEMGGYLWAFFEAEGGYEKIFFGYSADGLVWQKLNKDDAGVVKPIMVNDVKGGDLGVRDPHIIRSHDGKKYWILGTDLHAEGGGAGGSGWDQYSASRNLVVWESEDLVNWSEPKLVFAGMDTAGCVWAPEAIYDEVNNNYVVYWSARDYSYKGTAKDALRVYVCRTEDFNTFTTPKVWLSENNNGENIIDTTIAYDGQYFYRFSTSDWFTVIDRSKTLDTDDVLDVTVNPVKSQPKGSWERIVTRTGYKAAGFDEREGMTVYQLPDGKWCAMGDKSGYAAFITDNLASGKFKKASASFLDGRFRHGTVMRLTKDEEKAVLEAYGKGLQSVGGSLDEKEAADPVLEYNFDNDFGTKVMTDTSTGNDSRDNGIIYGSAAVEYDSERGSNVLRLDGSDGAYAAFPAGFFDYRNTMSICMDVKSELSSGNFFTFTYGKNDSVYNFLRIRGSEVRNAITTGSYQNESEVKGTGAAVGTWQNIAIVIDNNNMKLYINGKMVSENTDTGVITSYLGNNLLGYLGRSMYSADGYFKGSFDNIKIYNRVITPSEILAGVGDNVQILNRAVIGTAPDRNTAVSYRGTDYHTAVYAKIDYNKKYILPYVKNDTDIKNIPVYFDMISDDAGITVDDKPFVNGGKLDLTKGAKVKLTFNNKTEEYSVKPPIKSNNCVLPGQYADPDIDYFDGKFWIFPTTDGYPGWSGTLFHAWSSKDMTAWEDEGVIMELANDNPGRNEKGVQIAASPWAVKGSAWAPAIEKKNGKYYFYYCGKDSSGKSAIGVASADKPAGPYVDLGSPLITVDRCEKSGVSMGQAIDPSIFTDDDGKSYITFGNGKAAIAELGEDMMSIADSGMRQINGLTDFRESVVVIKREGKYHWTWTCDDANSPNYRVNYGVSDSLYGNITLVHRPLLQKNESLGILGTGHQSLLHVKDAYGADRYFIAYHRFYTPIDIFTSGDGLGVHRESCIDEVTFNDEGYMDIVYPSHEGVSVTMSLGDDNPGGDNPGDDNLGDDNPGDDNPGDHDQETAPTKEPAGVLTPGPDGEKPVITNQPLVPVNPATVSGTGNEQYQDKTGTVKAPVIRIKAKSSVKRGKKLVVKLVITNPDGSRVKWSLDKKGKKLFKMTRKKSTEVTLIAGRKKGKGVLSVSYGKYKKKKTIRIK